nr:MAG TPA: TOPRIM domain protein [Caudoviricetes sp.]
MDFCSSILNSASYSDFIHGEFIKHMYQFKDEKLKYELKKV